MCSTGGDAALPAPGFPIRESAGQRLFSASPRLIAAVHALLRLLVPRHPPSALSILTVIAPASTRAGRAPPAGTVISVRWLSLCGFQGPRSATAQAAGLSKLNSMCARSRGTALETRASPRSGRHARWPDVHADAGTALEELPRKEVIQPQLPLRLPCYDFTPITSPTFDGSLPKGLGHRLRVLPAFVV